METPESGGAKPAKRVLQQGEQIRLQQLLEEYGQTLEGKKRIAAELNISLRTLYRRLEAYKLG
jgi:transcriptional regulator with PAS, ATPase and Fis domain